MLSFAGVCYQAMLNYAVRYALIPWRVRVLPNAGVRVLLCSCTCLLFIRCTCVLIIRPHATAVLLRDYVRVCHGTERVGEGTSASSSCLFLLPLPLVSRGTRSSSSCLQRPTAALTYADVCCRILTYSDESSRMVTDGCWRTGGCCSGCLERRHPRILPN